MTDAGLIDCGFPPEATIVPISGHRLRVLEGPHPWYEAHAGAIAENWRAEVAANPHLFDGRMVFQRRLGLADGQLEGEGHMVSYATYLYWRRFGRSAGAHHLFAMPLIVSADGALIMVRMAETTANPGRVYPAAGSLDDDDIADGLCDLDGNMRREVLEETGLDLADMKAAPDLHAFHLLSTIAMLRIYRSDQSERDLLAQIAAHIATDPDPEISGAIGVRSPGSAAHNYSPFVPPVLEWLFSRRMA